MGRKVRQLQNLLQKYGKGSDQVRLFQNELAKGGQGRPDLAARGIDPSAIKGGQKVTVEAGDSYFSLAEKIYGDQRFFEQVMAQMGGGILRPGMTFTANRLNTGRDPVVSYGAVAQAVDLGQQLNASGSENALSGFDPTVFGQQIADYQAATGQSLGIDVPGGLPTPTPDITGPAPGQPPPDTVPEPAAPPGLALTSDLMVTGGPQIDTTPTPYDPGIGTGGLSAYSNLFTQQRTALDPNQLGRANQAYADRYTMLANQGLSIPQVDFQTQDQLRSQVAQNAQQVRESATQAANQFDYSFLAEQGLTGPNAATSPATPSSRQYTENPSQRETERARVQAALGQNRTVVDALADMASNGEQLDPETAGILQRSGWLATAGGPSSQWDDIFGGSAGGFDNSYNDRLLSPEEAGVAVYGITGNRNARVYGGNRERAARVVPSPVKPRGLGGGVIYRTTNWRLGFG